MKDQLQLFTNLTEITVGCSLDIWYDRDTEDGEASLHCTVSEICLEDGAIDFWVVNGDWPGRLYLHRNLVQIDAYKASWTYSGGKNNFIQISRWEFFDKRIDRMADMLANEFTVEEDLWDDVPF